MTILNKAKNALKQITYLRNLKIIIWLFFDDFGFNFINILKEFKFFSPNSNGSYYQKAKITINAAKSFLPAIISLIKYTKGNVEEVKDIEDLSNLPENRTSAEKLKIIFDRCGSDKASSHNYHHLYGMILRNKQNIKNIFEIGLGTNDPNLISSMGKNGTPGASLRAFKEYCSSAMIYGADIDRNILFNDEERIKTFFIDQEKPETFNKLIKEHQLIEKFDLVIDDGLHAVHSNISSLELGLKIIKIGGWVVIEDIKNESLDFWKVIASILPAKYKSYIFSAKGGNLFAINRIN